MADYDVQEALQAAAADDANYFFQTLPRATQNVGIVAGAPPPPSQRGWGAAHYSTIKPNLIGRQVREVLVPPEYPVQQSNGLWHDPNPPDNEPAAYVGQAPDGQTAIEIRFVAGRSKQFVEAYLPLMGETKRLKHVGVSLQVWTEAGFDWGTELTGGKVGGGLWGGDTNAQALVPPWNQTGVSYRNIWAQLASGLVGRGYAYILNRDEAAGLRGPSIPDVWDTGRWQTLEYEGVMNTPGFADGVGRLWIDGVCISEITGAIWSLDGTWYWRGVTFSDDWQDGDVPQDQKRWVRGLTMHLAPGTPFFSLSLQKGRVGEPKTTFNTGELPPTADEAVELRIADNAYPSKLAFWADLFRLLQRMRELNEPRPEFAGSAPPPNTYVETGYVDQGYVE